jgi:acylphosphatase
VQGVGFRAFVEDQAMRRNIAGWVRNRRDGTVEALFAGAAEAVADIIAACRKGPLGARVDAIDERAGHSTELKLSRHEEAFAVLPTL